MRRVLLLRPSGDEVPGADLLVTHRIVPVPVGIAATRTFDPAGAILVVSSRVDGRRPRRGGRRRFPRRRSGSS